jgi:hypothetical protein
MKSVEEILIAALRDQFPEMDKRKARRVATRLMRHMEVSPSNLFKWVKQIGAVRRIGYVDMRQKQRRVVEYNIRRDQVPVYVEDVHHAKESDDNK